jgi:hypothetical protein
VVTRLIAARLNKNGFMSDPINLDEILKKKMQVI